MEGFQLNKKFCAKMKKESRKLKEGDTNEEQLQKEYDKLRAKTLQMLKKWLVIDSLNLLFITSRLKLNTDH